MSCWTRRLTPLAVLLAAVAGFALAQDDTPAKAKDKAPAALAPKAPTYKVEKAPFKIETSLKGVFESSTMTEVALKPEVWGGGMGGFPVEKAVEPGTSSSGSGTASRIARSSASNSTMIILARSIGCGGGV